MGILKKTYYELGKFSEEFVSELKSDVHVRSGRLKASLNETHTKTQAIISYLEYGNKPYVWDSGKNPIQQLKTKKLLDKITKSVVEDVVNYIRKIFKKK